jgi:NADH-quinone oxidoreductase subunit M
MIGAVTVIFTAAYLLWTIQQMFLGEPRDDYEEMHMTDINNRELGMLIPLGIIVIVLGVYPHAVLDLMNDSLQHLNNIIEVAGAAGSGSSVALR